MSNNLLLWGINWDSFYCKQLSSSLGSEFQFVALHIATSKLDHWRTFFRMDYWLINLICSNKVRTFILVDWHIDIFSHQWLFIIINLNIFINSSTSRFPLLLNELVAVLQHADSSTFAIWEMRTDLLLNQLLSWIMSKISCLISMESSSFNFP